MNTVIAHNIKTGGGKELLEYLVEYVGTHCKEASFDFYVDKSLTFNEYENVTFHKVGGAFEKVSLFFKRFSNVLYFGNLPPFRKMKSASVYFHNLYLLSSYKEIKANNSKPLTKVKILLQQLYISLFYKNVNSVYCQTAVVKEKFEKRYALSHCKEFPFYRECHEQGGKKVYDFIYVSLAHPHKNHDRLLDACEILSVKGTECSLALTIQEDKTELLEKVASINSKGVVTIENLGIVPKQSICTLYNKSRALVFPSLLESFGLPILEAVTAGIDVIGADMAYTYVVVEPSLVFNPESAEDIAEKMSQYLSQDVNKTILLKKDMVREMCSDVFKF